MRLKFMKTKMRQIFAIQFWVPPGLVLLVTMLLSGCATNPVTGRNELNFVSESQEIGIGRSNYIPYQQQEGGPLTNYPEVTRYVQAVGAKLVAVSDRASLPYEFEVLNNSVPNAWALPGGKIAVNRGLLTELKSEAELAAVLGHEIVHAAARHGAKSMEQGILMQTGVVALGLAVDDHDYRDIIMTGAGLTAGLVGQKYSRSHESESDYYGMKYMAKAGYDTQAAVDLQETFVRLSAGKGGGWLDGLFASHPPSIARVNDNKKTLAQYPPGGFRGEHEYQKAMARLFADKDSFDKIGKGYQELSKKNPQRALQLADEALKLTPRESMAQGLAAKSLIQLNQKGQALERLDQAIGLNPNYFEFYRLRGLLRQELGRSGAEADLQKSMKLLPTSTAAYSLGLSALNRGDRREASHLLAIAGQANSEQGKDARYRLQKIQLAENPNSVLEIGTSLNAKGELVILVANRGGESVRNILLTVKDRAKGTARRMRLQGIVRGGVVSSFSTDFGPYTSIEEVKRAVRITVDSAEMVR